MANKTGATSPKGRLHLPVVREVTLRSFSLYSIKPELVESITTGVHCLAGANGIGKSSFLTAVAYGISGMVADPQQKFESTDEYLRRCTHFAQDYFTGRIGSDDYEQAEIALVFTVGDTEFRVTRGFFETGALRALRISQGSKTIVDSTGKDDATSPSDLHDIYVKWCVVATNLANFGQLAFILHFCMSFDERRLLLFWEEKVIEQLMYLTFGISSTAAHEADQLRREVEKLDSRRRNSKWDNTQTLERIKQIQGALRDVNLEEGEQKDLHEEHKLLSAKATATAETHAKAIGALQDVNLEVAMLTASIESKRVAYEKLFKDFMEGTEAGISRHPLLAETFATKACALCGSTDSKALQLIVQAVKQHECPLCNSKIEAKASPKKAADELSKLDEDLTKLRDDLRKRLDTRIRAESREEATRKEMNTAGDTLARFESDNERVLTLLGVGDSKDVPVVVAELRKQADYHLKQAKEFERRRDKCKRSLGDLRMKLKEGYDVAEREFVPVFKQLAEEFIGLDLGITLSTRSIDKIALTLEISGTHRREHFQLSESQGFFVDIALRMALLRYMTGGNGSTLLLDTPEGSLDIAYETRAGEMIAKYVEGGQSVLMTANINTSRLLLSLAERCGRGRMKVARMMDWAELSNVQLEQEALFEEAMKLLDKALDKKKGQ